MGTKNPKGGGTSTVEDTATDSGAALATKGKDASGLIDAVDKETALAESDGQMPQSILSAISQQTLDEMNRELQEALRQIDNGFGDLTKPGDIFKLDQAFWLIDGFTIPDYEDRKTGEIKTKHVFRLEFADGLIRTTMQSDARPRRVYARAFTLAAQLGGWIKIGPVKFEKKPIVGQIEPAFIFVPQPGFAQVAY